MILKQVLPYLSIMLLVTGCFQFSEPEKPTNLISKENMVKILIDAKILGSANMANKRIMEEHGVQLGSYVFEKHNIDSLQFAQSNEYYAFHIEEYEEIYEKVKDSLDGLKVFYTAIKDKEIAKAKALRAKDSIEIVTKLKDSISNLKLHDSIKTRLKEELGSDPILIKKIGKNIEAFIEKKELEALEDIEALEAIEAEDLRRMSREEAPKLLKPISDKGARSLK
ncbi:DUF4296 domain-containing protein [Algibacter miyuki]|uniref:DUF4296 domain-containing protein n=1 Tax=Algibacter miyuki TaxID=1306933 RepID=A0ABV5GXK2_9FLAO|nr:DUF4296 domain-containing protein [Algibacter miyuki]MDN3665260.1 DUF4296 domain-containing protein [Algibacter miyuki]